MVIINIQIGHWGYIIGIVVIGMFSTWIIFKTVRKKKSHKEISNYIIISEDKTLFNHRLLLKYFDGIKSWEYPIKTKAVLEIKIVGTLTEGTLQAILVDECSMPIKIFKNMNNNTFKYIAQRDGKFIIKLIGYQAKGKFGIECKITA
ncbi:hypothetical protein [Cellulosilyticum sp. I15G10I2]|uniref:hypothetical protein n=1 Tax=Cellulosilyticum sp. I15G10I2 TaxID=1892843 RepID=UPI00085BB377|nr:hypothetical protein [Cellulosilyticum sp. I15G10I2]